MKKWVIGVLCAILIVFFIVLVALLNLGTIVTTAVNSYGPGITKTEIRLGKTAVSVFKGQLLLESFVLGNPKEFSSPNAITIGAILVDVDESTLTKDPIVIDRIEVFQPEITYEIKGTTDNFQTIINNLKKPKSPGTPEEKENAGGKNGKKIVIRDLILKDIRVKTAAEIAGGDIATTTISEIHLKNIGEKQNGVDAAQAVLIVLNDLYGQVISPDVLGALKDQLNGLGKELDGVTKNLKSLGGQMKGLFDR